MNNSPNLIIQALKDQREIFGDDLYESLEITNNGGLISNIVNEESNQYMASKSSSGNFEKCRSLKSLKETISDCQKCELGKTRNRIVFGDGNPKADVMIIGEAPGAEEDKQGIPFVGRSGKLLTDILKAIKFEREDVYIANILKCRPPANRNPSPAEMDECTPHLYKQIALIKPKAILCVGLVAATSFLKQKESLTKMRGNVYEVQGIKTMVTYHPAALLRNPNWKKGCWEDVQKFRKLYESLI